MLNRILRPAFLIIALAISAVIGANWQIIAGVLNLPLTKTQPLATFTENEVRVDIALEKIPSGQMLLVGTFTPKQEHFHLYSKDFPREGIDGIGRPTLVEITSEDVLQPIGALIANQASHDFYSEELKQSFPVYPDGAVILSLPVKLVSNGNNATLPIELSVTYLACGNGVCLPPVIDKRITAIISTNGY